jgi:hypothetical protein
MPFMPSSVHGEACITVAAHQCSNTAGEFARDRKLRRVLIQMVKEPLDLLIGARVDDSGLCGRCPSVDGRLAAFKTAALDFGPQLQRIVRALPLSPIKECWYC